MIGGQVGIVGHISIADEVKIAAQSGVSASIIKVGEIVQGSPSLNIKNSKCLISTSEDSRKWMID